MIEWIRAKAEEKNRVLFRAITLKDIVLEPSLRTLCESNQCGQYGTNWMCPPDVGSYKALTERVKILQGRES